MDLYDKKLMYIPSLTLNVCGFLWGSWLGTAAYTKVQITLNNELGITIKGLIYSGILGGATGYCSAKYLINNTLIMLA